MDEIILNENDVTVPAEIRVRNPLEGRYVRIDTNSDSTDTETENTATNDNWKPTSNK